MENHLDSYVTTLLGMTLIIVIASLEEAWQSTAEKNIATDCVTI